MNMKHKVLLVMICFLLLLSGCKSKQEKANDYLNNKEYKKAHDILYKLDDDHGKADECLLEWCQYNMTFKVLDSDISSAKFTNSDNAKIIYENIKDYCKDISKLSKNQIEIIESILPCIGDFYKNDNQFIKIKGNLDNQLILEEYYENNEYKKAYDFLYNLDEYHTRIGECLARWYKYCFDKGKIDDDLIDIPVSSTIKLFDTIMEYLDDKVCPTKEQCELILSVLDKHEDNAMREIDNYSVIKKSLQCKVSGNYMYEIPSWNSLTYDKYYSTIHNYSEENLNKTSEDVKMYADKFGLGVARYDEFGSAIDIEYFLFGDYSNYQWVKSSKENGHTSEWNVKSSTVSICTKGNFDGYWYYYFIKNSDGKVISLNRISIYNENEEILSQSEIGENDMITAFVLDHDILYTYVENKDSKLIYRIYLPEKVVDTYSVSLMQQPLFVLLVPEDSEHLSYQTYGEEYYKKYAEIRNDKDKFYKLLVDNNCKVDKEDFYNLYENSFDEPNNNQYVVMIGYCFKNQYGKDILQQYRYDYDLKNKKIEVTAVSDISYLENVH